MRDHFITSVVLFIFDCLPSTQYVKVMLETRQLTFYKIIKDLSLFFQSYLIQNIKLKRNFMLSLYKMWAEFVSIKSISSVKMKKRRPENVNISLKRLEYCENVRFEALKCS